MDSFQMRLNEKMYTGPDCSQSDATCLKYRWCAYWVLDINWLVLQNCFDYSSVFTNVGIAVYLWHNFTFRLAFSVYMHSQNKIK